MIEVSLQMSETESDVEFESADEGEESELKSNLNIPSIKENDDIKCLSYTQMDCDKNLSIHNSKEENVFFNDDLNKVNNETSITEPNPLNAEMKEEKFLHNLNENDTTEGNIKHSTLQNTEENTKYRSEEKLKNIHMEQKYDSDKNDQVKTSRVKLRFEERLEKSQKKNMNSSECQKKQVLEKMENLTINEKNSGWNWGGWKSSIFSTAASSVSVFTTQVSQGIGTVFETVEATLGVPPPEELVVSMHNKEQSKDNEILKENSAEDRKSDNQENSPSLFEGVSSLTKVIENTGSKVIMGGLDTLELIGKKTFDILTEGDPGLRKKRSYFANNNSLSEILKEAKEKEISHNSVSEENAEITLNYSVQFDNFQGLVHLEALELLSAQNRSKVQELLISKSTKQNIELKKKFEELKNICEDLSSVDDILDDDVDHDFFQLTENYITNLKLNINIANLQQVQKRIRDWLVDCKRTQEERIIKSPKEIYNEAITSLAELAAKSIVLYHKISELLLAKSADISSPISYAKQLTELTEVICLEIRIIAAHFCQCLNTAADDSPNPDSVTPFITNVYLEASNSTTYIQDAFQLLLPIFQIIILKQEDFN